MNQKASQRTLLAMVAMVALLFQAPAHGQEEDVRELRGAERSGSFSLRVDINRPVGANRLGNTWLVDGSAITDTSLGGGAGFGVEAGLYGGRRV